MSVAAELVQREYGMALEVFVFLLLSTLVVGSQASPIKLSSGPSTTPRPLLRSPLQGGNNTWGSPFDDGALPAFKDVVGLHSLTVSASTQVNFIQATYLLANGSLYVAPSHGAPYNNPKFTVMLGPREYLERIEGKTDSLWVRQLTFIARGPEYRRRVYGPFGKDAPTTFAFEGNIVSFHGFESSLIYRIGVYTLGAVKRSEGYGGSGGDVFDEQTDLRNPPIVGITKLHISVGPYWVQSLQAEYLLLGGATIMGAKHGNSSWPVTTISFDEGEVIRGLEGEVSVPDGVVSQVTIATQKEGGGEARYGPFGTMGTTPFSIHGSVLGFHGSVGKSLNKLGAYYV